MDYTVVHDLFINFENQVNSNIQKRIISGAFYSNNVIRKPWPTGQGRTFTYPSYERAGLPNEFLPFTPIAAYGTGSTCDIPVTEVGNYAANMRSVTLYQTATHTPDFCLTDFEYDWQIEAQLEISVQNMTRATKFNWENELQNRYIASVSRKTIYTDDNPTGATWDATVPTNPLDWAILEYVYDELRYEVTPEDGVSFDEEGKLVLVAVGGFDVFNQLKNQDGNFRNDLNAVISGGKESNTLIGSQGMPTRRSYRGFTFEHVQFDPRYDFVEGEWVQRFPYEQSDALNGVKLDVSELWKRAKYTDVVIFTKGVFDHLVPQPPKSRSGYEWKDTIDWRGQHSWKKLPHHKQLNPDENKGYWRSVYAYGPQIKNPELGWVIRVKRCAPKFGQVTCDAPGTIISG